MKTLAAPFAFAAALWLAAIPLRADDIVRLKSGPIMKGRIISETDKSITLQMGSGTCTFPRTEIKSVQKGPAEAGPARPAPSQPPAVPVCKGPRGIHPESPVEDLSPAAVIDLNVSILDMRLSRDRRWVFLLDSSAGRVRRLDTATGVLTDVSAEAGEGAAGLCLRPDGTVLYAFSSPSGRFREIDPETMKIKSAFLSGCDPYDAVADDRGRLYITSATGQSTYITVVDTTRQAIVGKWGQPDSGMSPLYRQEILRLHPEQKRLYYGSTGLSPGDFHAVIFPEDVDSPPVAYDSPYHGEHPLGGMFELTPDGRFLIGGGGPVLRLGTNRSEDLKYLTKIAKHSASAFDGEGMSFLAATAEGELKVYSVSNFELEKTFRLSGVVNRLLYDAKAQVAYAIIDAGKGNPPHPRKMRTGNLHIYNLGDPPGFPGIKPADASTGETPPAASSLTAGEPVSEVVLKDETTKTKPAKPERPEVERDAPCPLCNGKGCAACGDDGKMDLGKCPRCKGSGQIYSSATVLIQGRPIFVDGPSDCPTCGGFGYVVLKQ